MVQYLKIISCVVLNIINDIFNTFSTTINLFTTMNLLNSNHQNIFPCENHCSKHITCMHLIELQQKVLYHFEKFLIVFKKKINLCTRNSDEEAWAENKDERASSEQTSAVNTVL
ncbi:hypothetical protein PUN28_016973 [Cardiocondyla obscurior]|uniref:Secreted protein n=1 Tax=Cardiocondyla obscurior TaxID=286306 RepID=A0AAW2EKY7_9HYME